MDEEILPCLSMRGGFMVMKGVSRFLASTRNKVSTETISTKPKTRKKMSDKENTFKCSLKIVDAMKKETTFSRSEIEFLYRVFKKLVAMNQRKPDHGKVSTEQNQTFIGKPNTTVQEVSFDAFNFTYLKWFRFEGIDRAIFREILHNTFDIVTEIMIMDRIFGVWDKANISSINLESWFHGVHLFLKGTSEKQIEFCFAVYDINADGFITKEEMFQLLKNCLIKHPQDEDPEESVKDLVEIVLKKFDKDKDGKVSLDDYKMTIEEEPLLLQAFGICLPSERAKEAFLSTMK